jgi:vacuolar iron transporter family protein
MDRTRRNLLAAQRNEITEHFIYKELAKSTKSRKNKAILERISADELSHHGYWKSVSGAEIKPDSLKIWFYVMMARLFGLSFTLKLMERGERLAQKAYDQLGRRYKKGKEIMLDEQRHEKQLLSMLEEEKLEYASSIVLGLNDALVELTGALAGFTFAIQEGRLIAVIGLITGIAASMSMSASAYLSALEEKGKKTPMKSALYTGSAYLVTVILLIAPFFMIDQVFWSLAVSLTLGIAIILSYTFYISVAKELPFWPRFIQMTLISLAVAAVSFGIGWLLKSTLGIDV